MSTASALSSLDLLRDLVRVPSVSRTPNLALIHHVQGLLAARGIACTLVHDDTGTRANLFASVGPTDVPGVMLSGHTDVVPVEGQAWTMPPFEATERDGRVYGRGTADMKGFVACAVTALLRAASLPLRRPLQIALSYDEEIGCVGVRRLIAVLEQAPLRPMLCVVGEPTMMQIATGHKGKMALRAVCCGREGHSALAPQALNAIHLATDLIAEVRTIQRELQERGARDDGYDVPYSTLHVGTIHAGKALNIVPNRCEIDFEIRHLAADDPRDIQQRLADVGERLASAERDRIPEAAVEVEFVSAYPGLDEPVTSDAVRFLSALLPPDTTRLKVAYGTEGGLFHQALGTPVVVCGPGSISVAHKPDEYVDLAQLAACDAFLSGLIQSLTT
jgi:acetylornithine deacetylase